jgi:hypothetical protein
MVQPEHSRSKAEQRFVTSAWRLSEIAHVPQRNGVDVLHEG